VGGGGKGNKREGKVNVEKRRVEERNEKAGAR